MGFIVGAPANLAKLLGNSGFPAALYSPTVLTPSPPNCSSLKILLVSPASLPVLGFAAARVDNKAAMLLPDSDLLNGPTEENDPLLLCDFDPTYDDVPPTPKLELVPGMAMAPGTEAGGETGESIGGVS